MRPIQSSMANILDIMAPPVSGNFEWPRQTIHHDSQRLFISDAQTAKAVFVTK